MRLESVRIRSLGAHRDIAVDLAQLGGPIVAVVGPNGAGKSTLLELALPGACYRSTPTRGSLADLATARDALLESRIVYGRHAYTLRHVVDGVSGKGEAAVFDETGAPVLPDSKVRSFDQWAARALPAPEVMFAALFGVQGSAGFLGMRAAERKGVLLRALGVERLERLADGARERQREAKAALSTLAARITDARAGSVSVAQAERELEHAQRAAAGAAKALADVRAELEHAEAAWRAYEEARRAHEAVEAERAKLTAELAAKRAQLADTERRIANNRAVLAEAEAIREAVATAERLRAELAELDVELGRRRAAAERHAEAAKRARAAAKAAKERAERAAARAQEGPAIKRAQEAIPAAHEALRVAAEAVDGAEAELERLRGERVAGVEERITSLREGLAWIRDAEGEPAQRLRSQAGGSLAADDLAVRQAEELPAAIVTVQGQLQGLRAELDAKRRALAELERMAARAPEIEAAAREVSAATQDEELALEEAEREEAARNGLVPHELEEQRGRRVLALEQTRGMAAQAEPLARAEARLAELEPQAEAARAEIARLEAELEALPAAAPFGMAPPDTGLLRQRANAAEATDRRAHSDLAVAEQRLEQARATAARLAELEAERERAESELADWTRLAADLGRDGLQAAEIDAAGPELTELVNDLLHSCFGPRWAVAIETTRMSADGRRQLEGLEVRVIDTLRGREAEASTFSGGERVILGEAVSLALSMLACRRAGLDGITLVRDESGAALSPENARAYVAMLRRAAQIVRADRVLVVSHSPEVVELADDRIVLSMPASEPPI